MVVAIRNENQELRTNRTTKMSEMDDVFSLLCERNSYETYPFLTIYDAYKTLHNQVDFFQERCEALEREVSRSKERSSDHEDHKNSSPSNSDETERGSGGIVYSKTESQLMDKVEGLQKELNERHRINGEVMMENKDLRQQNDELVERFVTEKESTIEQMNKMNDMVESLQKEIDLLRALLKQKEEEEKKRKEEEKKNQNDKTSSGKSGSDSSNKSSSVQSTSAVRRWGALGVVPPTQSKYIIDAHPKEALAVRYSNDIVSDDYVVTTGPGSGGGGGGLASIGSSSSKSATVKIWDTKSGTLKYTLRGNSIFLDVDIGHGLVVASSTDKTCRVWSLKTQRMIHHLVGHAQRVNCIRLNPLDSGKSVITASADRSMKVWNIARNTYYQNLTLRHGSTALGMDFSSASNTLTSCHVDGGLRFWDLRSGERTAEIPNLHLSSSGGISTVQFNPMNSSQLFTHGKDSTIKIVDVRMCNTIFELKEDFSNNPRSFVSNSFNGCNACYSPNGKYIASTSSYNGGTSINIWNTDSGKSSSPKSSLNDVHNACITGIAWGAGGSSGQQFASVDKNGQLVLWS